MRATASSSDVPPYYEVVAALVASTMRAQAALLKARLEGSSIELISDATINTHFAWLTQEYREGTNRHLFDAIDENFPLRKRRLRQRSTLPREVSEALKNRSALDITAEAEELIQSQPTRISRLIRLSCMETLTDTANPGSTNTKAINPSRQRRSYTILLKSPLCVVYDYLTIPEFPGSRAYALLSLRTYLLEIFGIVPAGLSNAPPEYTFSIRDVEDAMSHIWTSLRPRHWSAGQDKLPREGRTPSSSLVRQFLALKGLLWFRFSGINAAIQYCSKANLRGQGEEYAYSRSPHLEHLPDLGEIVNELWGLPIPVRGADTVLRGGLRFSSRRGLVVAVHGSPGSGKTSFALGISAYLAPFGIDTLFLTAEETEADLRIRAEGLIPDEYRRMSFFPKHSAEWLWIQDYKVSGANSEEIVSSLEEDILAKLQLELLDSPNNDGVLHPPKPCRAIVVLDGLHDLFAAGIGKFQDLDPDESNVLARLREFIDRCRALQALVILTTGEEWVGDAALDYLVDVTLRLSQGSVSEYGQKPDRRLLLLKARHQLCAIGSHGLQIAGSKGLRLSPQINYQLDRQAIWQSRLPNTNVVKAVLRRITLATELTSFPSGEGGRPPNGAFFFTAQSGIDLYRGSSIFLNGRGSSGKAALALKIAIAPSYQGSIHGSLALARERVLVISFLYPREYYVNILERLVDLREVEYGIDARSIPPRMMVIHLYPGYLRPNDLFNRIIWELDAAELHGDPYTSVVIDGIHNVYLQFPEIESYKLFWPQLYAALRARPLTIITTHTTLVVPGMVEERDYRVDDARSEPLRHVLVQKTDFQFEIDFVKSDEDSKEVAMLEPNVFAIRALSAINQPIPRESVLWSRERLILFESPGPRQADAASSRNARPEADPRQLLLLGVANQS